MKLLGLHVNTGQTAAALLVDGEIRHAAAEERFNRIKQSRDFPKKAIDFCLSQAGLNDPGEFDGIAISWNPAENMRHINLSGFTSWRRYDPEWLYMVPNNIMSMAGEKAFAGETVKMELGLGEGCPLYFVDHHRCHLAHAICQSPFEKGLAAAVDEYSEFNSVTLARFDGGALDIVKQIPYPNSLGVLYAAFTEYLGYTPNSDEWKVMGASAYGDPTVFYDKLAGLIAWDDDNGDWVLDTRYIEHSNMKRAGYLNERLVKHIGFPVRNPSVDLQQIHYDLAASLQAVFEERLMQILTWYGSRTGETNLAASGGCFMNSAANGKIIANTPFDDIFIPYAAADNGGAMGAALYAWHYMNLNVRKLYIVPPTPFLGPEFTDEDIEHSLGKYNLTFEKTADAPAYAARCIADGKLVGWFQGKMEFGERALGNRSILADPRDNGMKDTINAAVKYRESFRPFAPSILAEKTAEYFEIPDGVIVPYMEQVYPVKKEKRGDIPAIVHEDGTGRLQMVSKETNPLFHALLSEFETITGIPVVLNTSFNVQGEPIVCSVSDAVRTFYTCGLDVLVIGNYCVEK